MDAHLISERLNQTADQRDLARQLIRMVEAAPLRIRDYVLSIVYSLISFVRIPDESFFLGLLRRLSLLDVDSLGESVPAWAEALRIILRPTRDQTQMQRERLASRVRPTMRMINQIAEDWPEVLYADNNEAEIQWSRLPIEAVLGIEELNALEARVNRTRRVTVGIHEHDRQQWIDLFVEALAWHVCADEDQFEDEFVLVMAQCFDLAVLFQEPSDLEEFVYHVMELDGDEGALLIDYMRQMIRFFRRMGWEVTERTQETVIVLLYQLNMQDVTTADGMLEVWSEWIASGDMTRDERRILRFLEGHEAVEQVLQENEAQRQVEWLQEYGQRDRPPVVIERAESMDRVVNLFAGAKIAREAGAVEQVDTDRLLDERDAPFECTICLDSIVDPISLLECGHIFHQACLESQARSGRRECSVCRAQMRIAPVDTIRALVEWARGRPLLAREEAGAGGEVRGRKRRERSESPESPRQRARERSPSPDLL